MSLTFLAVLLLAVTGAVVRAAIQRSAESPSLGTMSERWLAEHRHRRLP
jgi:hypothetical protein